MTGKEEIKPRPKPWNIQIFRILRCGTRKQKEKKVVLQKPREVRKKVAEG